MRLTDLKHCEFAFFFPVWPSSSCLHTYCLQSAAAVLVTDAEWHGCDPVNTQRLAGQRMPLPFSMLHACYTGSGLQSGHMVAVEKLYCVAASWPYDLVRATSP